MRCDHCGNNMQIADEVNISCAKCRNYHELDFYPNKYIMNYPNRKKYDMRDVANVMIDSLFHNYIGGTLSEKQAINAVRFIAKMNNATLSKNVIKRRNIL